MLVDSLVAGVPNKVHALSELVARHIKAVTALVFEVSVGLLGPVVDLLHNLVVEGSDGGIAVDLGAVSHLVRDGVLLV